MPRRQRLPKLNEYCNIKHISHDLNLAGLPDLDVYELGVKLGRVIVTYNGKDFRVLVGTKPDAGVIDAPDHLPLLQLDNKLKSLLAKHSPNSLRGKLTPLITKQKK